MAVQLLKGVASGVERSINTVGWGNSKRSQTETQQVLVMRLDGKPLQCKSEGMFSVRDGEFVVAAGTMKNGMLEAHALQNMTTGAAHLPPTKRAYLAGVLLCVLGLPLSLLLIGLPLLGVGVYVLMRARTFDRSARMVLDAAAESDVATAARMAV